MAFLKSFKQGLGFVSFYTANAYQGFRDFVFGKYGQSKYGEGDRYADDDELLLENGSIFALETDDILQLEVT